MGDSHIYQGIHYNIISHLLLSMNQGPNSSLEEIYVLGSYLC